MIQLLVSEDDIEIIISAIHTEKVRAENESAKRAGTMYQSAYEEYVADVCKMQSEILRQAMHPAHQKE